MDPSENSSSSNPQATTIFTTGCPSIHKRKRTMSSSSSSPPFMPPENDSSDDDNSIANDYGECEVGGNGGTVISQSVSKRNNALMDATESDEENSSRDTPTGPTPLKLGSMDKPHKANTKKRRITLAGGGAAMTGALGMSATASSNAASWKDFCRQGTRFKALLDDAMVKVAAASTSTAFSGGNSNTRSSSDGQLKDHDNSRADSSSSDPASGSASGTTSISAHSLLRKLAQEKEVEHLRLQQKLEQEQNETATLQALLEDLHSTKKQNASQITRLTIALQQAAQNATQAREEADAAEHRAASLAIKIEALETVVQETKRASQQLLEEQDQVHESVRGMEAKYVQAQADLARSSASKQKMQQEHRSMKKQLEQMQRRLLDTNQALEGEKDEKQVWKHEAQELGATDKVLQDRVERLEAELQQSKTLLMEATSAASESQEAKQKVQSTLERMEEANKQLSEKLQESQKQLQRQDEFHSNALAQAQKDHQVTQHKWSHDRDLVQSLKIEKQAADKKVSQLQGKLAQAERRLLDSTNLTSSITLPHEETSSCHESQSNSVSAGRDGFSIPSLALTKENTSPLPSKTVFKCSICNKEGSGVMRKCQCGDKKCAIRAHSVCVQRITMQNTTMSVSHPGTPAPKLPVILCSNNGMKSIMDKRKSLATAIAVTPASSMISRTDDNPRASF